MSDMVVLCLWLNATNFINSTTRRHQKPLMLGLYKCVLMPRLYFSSLPLFLIPLWHSSYYHYPKILPNSYFLSPPPIGQYKHQTLPYQIPQDPLHIPKQNSPYNPYSHHITPLLILPLFQCSPWWHILQTTPSFTIIKGQSKYNI